MQFERYDAWILTAIIFSLELEKPVPLWRIIGTADALNKAILTRSELELGLSRLVEAGFVETVPGGFSTTKTSPELKGPGGPMKMIDSVAEAIGANAWSPTAPLPRTTDEHYVTGQDYKQAVDQYRKWFKAEWGS